MLTYRSSLLFLIGPLFQVTQVWKTRKISFCNHFLKLYHSSAYTADVTNERNYTSTPPVCLPRMDRYNVTFTFFHITVTCKYGITEFSGNH